MGSPLWNDTHAPALEDIKQDTAREFLKSAVDGRVNLFVYGPRGAGKTAAVNAFLREKYVDPENDVVRLNAEDFFSLSKKDLADDDRFQRFITPELRRESSKAGLLNHVLKEMAGYQPVTSDHKTLVVENAESMREDFQHALRRIMERHSETTQYVLVSREYSSIIDPIRSRCFPVPVNGLPFDDIVDIVTGIADDENVDFEPDAIEYLVGYAGEDLRESILALQTVSEQTDGAITIDDVRDTVNDSPVTRLASDVLDAAESGDITSARDNIDELLIDEGVNGANALEVLVDQSRARYAPDVFSSLVQTASDIDVTMREGTSPRVHLTQYANAVAVETE